VASGRIYIVLMLDGNLATGLNAAGRQRVVQKVQLQIDIMLLILLCKNSI